MHFRLTLCVGLCLSHTTYGQTKAPEFEVASIKPAAPQTGGLVRSSSGVNGNSAIYTNLTLKSVLMNAFGVKGDQIAGPEWLDATRFDITARLPEGATKDQVPAMLLKLMESRFHMAAHRDMKDTAVYDLVVAKNGPKLKPATDPARGASMSGSVGKITIQTSSTKMPAFASLLSNYAGRPVIDKTELTEAYSIAVTFAPITGGATATRSDGVPVPEAADPAPSIFSAMPDQLGLRLEPARAPIQMIVIDHVDKEPTEN